MRTSAVLFWLNRVCGAIVLLGLAIHLFVQHFLHPVTGPSFARVIAMLRHPFFLYLDGILLLAVLYKALWGLRSVLYDYEGMHRAMRFISFVLAAGGVVLAVIGLDTLVEVASFR